MRKTKRFLGLNWGRSKPVPELLRFHECKRAAFCPRDRRLCSRTTNTGPQRAALATPCWSAPAAVTRDRQILPGIAFNDTTGGKALPQRLPRVSGINVAKLRSCHARCGPPTRDPGYRLHCDVSGSVKFMSWNSDSKCLSCLKGLFEYAWMSPEHKCVS